MLCLKRGLHETIHIDTPAGEIVVTVLERRHCGPGDVRLGIQAPRELTILRGELIERERREGKPFSIPS